MSFGYDEINNENYVQPQPQPDAVPQPQPQPQPQLKVQDLTPGQLKYVLEHKYDSIQDPKEKIEFLIDVHSLNLQGNPVSEDQEKLLVVKDFVENYAFRFTDENGELDPEAVKGQIKTLVSYQLDQMEEYAKEFDANPQDPEKVLNGKHRARINGVNHLIQNMSLDHYSDGIAQRQKRREASPAGNAGDILMSEDYTIKGCLYI